MGNTARVGGKERKEKAGGGGGGDPPLPARTFQINFTHRVFDFALK